MVGCRKVYFTIEINVSKILFEGIMLETDEYVSYRK